MSSCSIRGLMVVLFSLLDPMPTAAVFRQAFKAVMDSERSLTVTKEQVTVLPELPVHAAEDLTLDADIEVDQDVAQKNNVDARQRRPCAGQIHLDKLNHGTKILFDFPIEFVTHEIAAEILHREAAIYFELAVAAALCAGQDVARQVGCDNPARPV